MSSFIANLTETLRLPGKETSTNEDPVPFYYPDLLRRIYFLVARALFKYLRPAYALYLVRSSAENLWTSAEWGVFTGKLCARSCEPTFFPQWADRSCKSSFAALLEHCPGVIHAANLEETVWKAWAIHQHCEAYFPTLTKLTAVERLLLVQALRPDRLMAAVDLYCRCELGVDNLDPPEMGLDYLVAMHSKGTGQQNLLVTSQGYDPGPELETMAEKAMGRER